MGREMVRVRVRVSLNFKHQKCTVDYSHKTGVSLN